MRIIRNDDDPYLQQIRAQAAQQVVEAFSITISYNRDRAENALVADMLDNLYPCAPVEWARKVAGHIIEIIRQLQKKLAASRDEIHDQNFERLVLQKEVDAYRANPLQAQLAQAIADRDRWQARVWDQSEWIKTLQSRLDAATQLSQYQAGEIERMQGEIVALNRIVAELQEQVIGAQ